jgi:hypothetical protein
MARFWIRWCTLGKLAVGGQAVDACVASLNSSAARAYGLGKRDSGATAVGAQTSVPTRAAGARG